MILDPIAIIQQVSPEQIAGLSSITIFAALFFGTFVSEDAACVAAGALAAQGNVSFPLAVASCFLGIVVGDLLLYGVGRSIGSSLFVERIAHRFVSRSSIDRASEWLDRRGASAVFLSRFMTGLRLPTYLAAGFLKTNFLRFALYFVIAAAVWTPLIVGAAVLSGEAAGGRVIVAAIFVFVTLRLAIKFSDRRRRQIAVGKIKRIWRWEFWPIWIFYFPVVCHVVILAVRHRSLTAFTCANPGISSGGFVGESKDAIYSLIGRPFENRDFVLQHTLISAASSQSDRSIAALRFMSSNAISYPMVLKPDAGERGKGVRIVNSHDELETALTEIDRDHILQEFCAGDEVSVFYYRHPRSERGEIYSTTRKIFPVVTGDGVSTLEKLILDDPRAVCLAEKYFSENAERLDHVPAPGEKVRIIEIGTHSRGAIFAEGEDLRTPELEDAIDKLCRGIDGFCFGRFDIRFQSLDEFRLGRGFKIIELNGVTSESTNIYDPRYSLIDAYRILFKQWRLAFEIGLANRSRGAIATSMTSLIRESIASITA